MKTASFKVTIKLWEHVDRDELCNYWLQRWEKEITETLKAANFEPKSVKGIFPQKRKEK